MKKKIMSLALALSLLLTSCGGGTSAATMHLRKTEGTVGVSDDGGKEITPQENLGLYSGYGVDTQAESYAWIDLDDVKLVKLDEASEIAITKDGKSLEIDVVSGNLFFNVTQPLADDEMMNIRTSTMMVGIRGTCGWVTQDAAALLEGTVEVTAGEQAVTISAGEMAVLTADGTLEVRELSDIPAFVLAELEDGELTADIYSGTPAGTMPADHVMDWRDEALAAKMAEVTGITDREIMLSDVWELRALDLQSAGIRDVSALGELTNLYVLNLGDNNISDISALSSLTNLEFLALFTNDITDISSLSALTSLQGLDSDDNNISDISALSGLTSLQVLDLSGNSISDVSALSSLTNLQSLVLQDNDITDISPLSGLTGLQLLDLSDNNISDVSALSSLTNLQQMQLTNNKISDISALGGLTNLTYLNLGGNNITDCSPVEFVPDLVKPSIN